MAIAGKTRKSAVNSLNGSFSELVSQAKKRLPEEDFKRAEKKFDEIASKVRDSRGRRRETA
jgi:hypothetical protein